MDILAFISPFLIGSAIIVILFPENSLKGAWLVLTISLGAGIGLGITSSAIFIWLALLGPPNSFYFTAELVLALLLGILAFYRFRNSADTYLKNSIVNDAANGVSLVWLRNIFIFILLISMVSFAIKAGFINPYGKWDAWAVWNYRARWLFKGGDQWTQAFTYQMVADAPDYPLLISASVFRMWKLLAKDFIAVPILIAGIFTFGSILLIFSSLAILRGKNQACLAAMFMLITTQFLKVGTYQYSDVPLAFFILSTVILISLKDQYTTKSWQLSVLVGLAASCAAWTKNEGLLFLVLVIFIRLLGQLRKVDGSKSLKSFFSYILGLAPVLSTLIYFKINFAFENELIGPTNFRKSGAFLFEGDRYLQVLTAFIKKILTFNDKIIWLLVVYLLISGLDKSGFKKRKMRSHLFLMVFMLVGYFFSYIISPYNLRWHLNSSLYRLIIQLWPAWVFLFFYNVKGPEKSIVAET
jgi:hypothetical protein